jgi:hypothetical protein
MKRPVKVRLTLRTSFLLLCFGTTFLKFGPWSHFGYGHYRKRAEFTVSLWSRALLETGQIYGITLVKALYWNLVTFRDQIPVIPWNLASHLAYHFGQGHLPETGPCLAPASRKAPCSSSSCSSSSNALDLGPLCGALLSSNHALDLGPYLPHKNHKSICFLKSSLALLMPFFGA